MKRSSSGPDNGKPRKGGIKWDEDNLEENERIKKELNPRKIDEPKTPYLSPQATEDEDEMLEDGVSPLSLDDNAPGPSAVPPAVRTHKSPWSDSSDQNGGSPSPRAPSNSNGNGAAARDRSCSRSPRFSEEYYRGNSDDEDEESTDSAEEELYGSGVGDEERKMKKIEKRKKFQEARKAHYGMKEALQKAKELLEDEIEDEEIDTMVESERTERRNQTVWIATWGYSQNCAVLTQPGNGGFVLPASKSKTFSVPDDWCSGRIWARTGCSISSSGVFKCKTGDCGGLKCTVTGEAPATLAEFTLGSKDSPDYYDMSLVDGYNVGMEIRPVNGRKVPNMENQRYNCGAIQCGTPKKPFKMSLCPKELRTRNNQSCMSICQAVVHKNTQNTAYIKNYNQAQVCCSCDCGPSCGCEDGKNAACKYGCSPFHPTQPPYDYIWKGVCDAKEWPKSSLGMSYTDVFKKQCPDAYSWQFDDLSSTFQCKQADYVITVN